MSSDSTGNPVIFFKKGEEVAPVGPARNNGDDLIGTMARQLSDAQANLTVARQQANTMHKQMLEAQQAERQAVKDLAAAREQHTADIKLIGERAIKLAKDEDWCDLYDTTITGLNEKLHVKLPVRPKVHRVDISLSIWVETSGGLDEAGDLVMERVGDTLRDAGFKFSTELDDVQEDEEPEDDE